MTKHRLQVDLTPEALARIDALVERTEASTRAEVVRHALSVYALLVDARRVVLTGADGVEREVVFPVAHRL